MIALGNRVIIEISTASFRTTRGYSFAAVLCDEIAFWRSDETSANPDVEIMRALRPGLSNIPGSVLLMASSPYAKRGELYNAFRRHHGKDDAGVLVWKAPTETMNSRVDPAIIAQAYESDPESTRAEYGAEFRDDLADFVTREVVDAVTMWGRNELPVQPGVTYAAFCDPSGGISDSMTLAVAHLQGDAVCVLDTVMEVRPPFDPEVAVAECTTLLKRFGVTRVTGDKYAGEWPRATFADHGISFEQSARPKSDIYHDLLPLLNARRVELLDHPRLQAQLVGLERRTSRQGKDSIDHARGGHDDLANVVAGVLVSLDLDRRPALVSQKNMLRDGAALPLPADCLGVFAVMAVDKSGGMAVVYAARTFTGPALLIIDFESGPLRGGLFANISEQIACLAAQCRARHAVAFVPGEMQRYAAAGGLRAEEIPKKMEPKNLLISAADHIARGSVKMCQPAVDRSRTSPFRSALDFRAAEGTDDPLRQPAVLAIALGLNVAA